MSPTLSELQDVLDWQAVAVLRAIDDLDGAPAGAVAETAALDRGTVETRVQQLETLGLIAEHDDGERRFDLTGTGHAAIGAGIAESVDLLEDVDDLAERVADLLDRRDDLRAAVEDLREEATELGDRAERQFGDREDVAEEFESLLADVEALADALAEE